MNNTIHTLADTYKLCFAGTWRGRIIEHNTRNELNVDTFKKHAQELSEIIDEANLQSGDKVIIKTTNLISTVVAMQVLWDRGLVVVPVKDNSPETVVRNIARNCNARMILHLLPRLKVEMISRAKTNHHQQFIFMTKSRVSGSDLALIIYTSGSTGDPKGIMLTHNNVISALNSISDYLELNHNDKILCLSPLSFDYGLYQILFAFKTNCTVVLHNNSPHPVLIAKIVKEHGITILPMLPAIAIGVERTLHLLQDYYHSLKQITNTGGHLPNKTIQGYRRKLPNLKIYAMYGLTESKRVFYLPPADIDNKLGSVGLPMPGLEARIFKTAYRDDRRIYVETVPYQVGLLYVRGPSVMQGYTQNEKDELVKLVEGEYRDDLWLCTGDLFYRDNDGYYYFQGRKKELIKQASYCIYPKEIEDLVNKHPDVYLNAVIADVDGEDNEIAHLFIKLENDTLLIRESVIDWLNREISKDYVPKKITFVNSIPLSENGKIDKKYIKNNLKLEERKSAYGS